MSSSSFKVTWSQSAGSCQLSGRCLGRRQPPTLTKFSVRSTIQPMLNISLEHIPSTLL